MDSLNKKTYGFVEESLNIFFLQKVML